LKCITRREDIFHASHCLYENNLGLKILTGISTDGSAAAMVSKENIAK